MDPSASPSSTDTPDENRSIDTLAVDLRVALMRVSRRLRTESIGDITPGQYSVLSALRAQPLTLAALADRERVRPPSMTRTVAALEAIGMITRGHRPEDRRQIVVDLTDKGRLLLDETRSRRTEWLATRLSELGPAEQKVMAQAAQILHRMNTI